MVKLDVDWAVGEIDRFLHVTGRVVPDIGPGIAYFGTVMRGPTTEAAERAHVIEQVLDRALPGWRTDRPVKDEDFAWLRDRASRAKAALLRVR